MKLNILKLYFKANKPLMAGLVLLTLSSLILSQFIFPISANADEKPEFNIFKPYVHHQTQNHDYFLLDVKNETQGTDWGFPVSAEDDDVLVFYLYYHNGIVDTTAKNTTLKVKLPTGEGEHFDVTGSLWADNAENATKSNPLRQSVGVNLDSTGSLKYIYGSAKWFPDRKDWRTDSPTPFPDGQNGDDLFAGGINIGSIKGCWEYSGAIVFKVKVNEQEQVQNLTIEKTASNMTLATGFGDSVNAKNNDRLRFKLDIKNTGDTTLHNVILRDTLPQYISYISDTSRLDGNFINDGITSGTINIGSLESGVTRSLTFEALINYPYNNDQALTNTGFARADKVSEKSDTATVFIAQHNNFNLSVAKTVLNVTAGQYNFSESVNAQNNDRLRFQIQIQNTGNAALHNLIVRDSLPNYISYVSGTTRLDGNFINDGITSNGINIGTLEVNATRNITFEAIVNTYDGVGNLTLTNTGFARADEVSEKSDTATVYVATQNVRDLSIEKTVRNITTGTDYLESVNAKDDDRLMFKVRIRNSGNADLNNVVVRDILPPYINYISGTTLVDGSWRSDGIVSGGINIGSIARNNERIITFEARIDFNGSGNQTLTNYAYARADEVSEHNDTAKIYINQTTNVYLTINKLVRNLTKNQNSLTESTNADSNDRIFFSIQIANPSSQPAYNVRVWDALPSGLTYVSGSARLDSGYISDSLISGGVNLGTFSSGQTQYITFEATVNSNINNQTLTNYAYTAADNISQQSDLAQVIVGQIITPTTFNKQVANLTSPNGSATANQATVGDILEYTLSYQNTSGSILYNAQVLDVLPSYTVFQSVASGGAYDSSKNLITWNVGTLQINASFRVSYQVKVMSVPQSGYVIENSALLQANNFSLTSNTVRTTVFTGPIQTITGSNSLYGKAAGALMVALWGIFFAYLAMEYSNYWRNLKFRFAAWKIKRKEGFA